MTAFMIACRQLGTGAPLLTRRVQRACARVASGAQIEQESGIERRQFVRLVLVIITVFVPHTPVSV
jgi:hypothetical protein